MNTNFRSSLATTIARYVALKQALGRQFESPRYHLGRLDNFLDSNNFLDLDATTFAAWCRTLTHLRTGGRRQRMRIVYLFCLFRRRTEPACFVPDPSQFPPHQPRPLPYIFSENEIRRLLKATQNLRPKPHSPLNGQVARLALVLLYTTGLRRGELIRLNLGDYDPVERVLLIRDSKFHKSRLLPLSNDAVTELDGYLNDRWQPGLPHSLDSPLLVNKWGETPRYSGTGFGCMMRKLFRKAGVLTSSGRPPRVHDSRFTFAVHALARWYRAKVDVQARLPALSVYLGHGSVVATQYYLTFFSEVAHAANQLFGKHCSNFLGGDQ